MLLIKIDTDLSMILWFSHSGNNKNTKGTEEIGVHTF